MLRKILFLLTTTTALIASDVEEIDLRVCEKSFYSQNGEDGVISKIFQLIGTSSRFCVEFGAYDGVTGSNTYLLRQQGWSALLLDRMFEIPEYNLYKEFIIAENISQLFENYNVPHDLDFLSIDLDYNDFYVWKALDRKYRPRVVLIEFNSVHLPNEDKVVQYRPYFCGDGTDYYGASILALFRLGRSKGYSLVYVENAGVHLFFIRDDVIQEKKLHFKNINNVEKLYTPPSVHHRKDHRKREYVSSKELLRDSL